jgi:hypothetical protein
VQPSLDDIEAFLAPFRNLPKVERQTHLQMPISADEDEVNAVLSMLAGELSDSARIESMAVAIGQNLGEHEEVHNPEGVHRKRLHRTNYPTTLEEKKRKKRLRQLSCLEQDVGPSTSLLDGGPESTTLEDDIRGCDDARIGGCVLDEDKEAEEEEIPLIRKNSRISRSSDILTQALSGLVSLQGLTMSAFDHALQETIPKNLLSEPTEVESSIVRSEVPDDGPLPCDPIGQEVTRTASRASSTFDGGLAHEDMLALDAAGQSHPVPLSTIEGVSISEVAAKEVPVGDRYPSGPLEGERSLRGALG